MANLLKKIFLADLLQGLWVTFRNQNPKYIYTERYPEQRPQVAERYRGAPRLNINPDNGETLCIACNLCALACPENLIVVGSERNEATRRNAVHSAISLIVSLLGVAGLYLMQRAEFLFAVQIVLYVGGIMVLFLFVIMLVNLDEAAKERQFNRAWLVGLVAVLAVGVEVGYFLYRGQGAFRFAEAAPALPATGGNTEMIANSLF